MGRVFWVNYGMAILCLSLTRYVQMMRLAAVMSYEPY